MPWFIDSVCFEGCFWISYVLIKQLGIAGTHFCFSFQGCYEYFYNLFKQIAKIAGVILAGTFVIEVSLILDLVCQPVLPNFKFVIIPN